MQILYTACNEHLHRAAECENFKIVLGPVGKSIITILYRIVYLESHFRDTVCARPFAEANRCTVRTTCIWHAGRRGGKLDNPPPHTQAQSIISAELKARI